MIALLLLLQTGLPSVTATVDETRLAVGEDMVLTVRASGTADEPLELTLPQLDGFEITARSERTEVSLGGTATRTTHLEVRLRAARSGTFRLGSVTVRQGNSSVRTAAITIVVSGAGASLTMSPRLRALLERAPPPRRPGEPGLTLVASSDRVYVGEQVDIVTAAWFPRDLRARLRRPPTLAPPALAGVWSYPQATPPGIAASRQVGNTWYDLFVSHQIVFPLTPGRLELERASLQYSVPVAMQFFSQEERYTLESNAVTLAVIALPEAGKPTGFAGAVGRRLSVTRTAGASVRAGEVLPIEVAIAGEGNVALWPAPDLSWPVGLRHYQDRTDDRMSPVAGRIGGTKVFRSLAMPDSAGPIRLPAISYPYFDLDAEEYRIAAAPGGIVMVAPATEAVSSRPTPPALLSRTAPPIATRVFAALPAPGWGIVAGLPALAWFLLGLRDDRRDRHRRRETDVNPALEAADLRLLGALRSLVPDAASRTGAALAAALRAAGVDTALAQRVARVRDEFLAARYGPPGGDARHEQDIMREMSELTRTLGGQSRHRERRASRGRAVAVMLLVLGPATAAAQAPAEQLYADGAFRAAAEAFGRRAAAEPDVPAHWYGLGAAEYRAGSDARARAAWLRAARLAPRSPAVRRALRLVPPPDPSSEGRSRIAPLTPAELAIAALMLWLTGWTLMLRGRPRVRSRDAALVAAGLVLGLLALGLSAYYSRPLAVVAATGPLRLSPHERAPEVAAIELGTAVRPARRVPGWVLVQGASGRAGWLEASALAVVSE